MNILSLQVGRDGCSGYRIKNPLKKIAKIDGHQVMFMEPGDSEDELCEMVLGADVIFMRQQHHDFMKLLKTDPKWGANSKLLVVDMDDDIFNISPFNPCYKWAGLEEVMYQGKLLWQDGREGFDIKRNTETMQKELNMLHNADLITVTTPYLKERIKEVADNEKIEVLPNSIDFDHWNKWPLEKSNEIRIGWTGGNSHYEDWYSIKDALLEVCKRHDNIKFVIQGAAFPGLIKDIPREVHSWIDFEGHPYKAASLNLDIAIIPLQDNVFNSSKSCIKWYEFSSLGVPCLVSNVMPYSTEIKNGDTAICYNDSREFVDGLERLITDIELRNRIGDNAQKWVRENRNLDVIAVKYIDIFNKYLNNKLMAKKTPKMPKSKPKKMPKKGKC